MSPADASQTSVNSLITVPQLKADGSNWKIYSSRFLAVTEVKGLTLNVEGLVTRPPAPIPLAPLSEKPTAQETATYNTRKSAYDSEFEKYKTDLKAFTMDEGMVRSIILSSVMEAQQIKLAGAKTAAEMWTALSKQYQNLGVLTQVDHKARMYKTACLEGGNPADTLEKLRKLKADLESAGGSMDDSEWTGNTHQCPPGTIPRLHCRPGQCSKNRRESKSRLGAANISPRRTHAP